LQEEAVFGIIFNEAHTQVLLIKRRDLPVWVLPGGGIDPGETPEFAVCRELLEETGYHVSIRRKIAEYSPVNRMTKFTHFFECEILSGTPTIGAETKEIQFFPLHHLPLLSPPFPGWIQDAAANHPTLIRQPIRGVSYWVLVKLLLQHPLLVTRFLLTKLGIRFHS
jgi:8-oxo-dGTP diphosphatase